ncbi:MAG: hypothetical protein KC910_31600 [Candidatus Eremiobacteraeota bacterium]|nr:hypothetical protein [Candidatus Eremiobacteraeota bacterium]
MRITASQTGGTLERERAQLQQRIAQQDQREAESRDVYEASVRKYERTAKLRKSLPMIGLGCTMVGVSLPMAGLNLISVNRTLGFTLAGIGLVGLAGCAASILAIEGMKSHRTMDHLESEIRVKKLAMEAVASERQGLAQLEAELQTRFDERDKLAKMLAGVDREVNGLQDHPTFVEVGDQSVSKSTD